MAQPSFAKFALALCLSFSCSGCGVVQYVKSEYKPEKRADGRVLTTLSLQPEDVSSPKVDVYKVHKGYALKGNLDWDEESRRKGDLVFSKTKEYDWFAGLQWRFEL